MRARVAIFLGRVALGLGIGALLAVVYAAGYAQGRRTQTDDSMITMRAEETGGYSIWFLRTMDLKVLRRVELPCPSQPGALDEFQGLDEERRSHAAEHPPAQ